MTTRAYIIGDSAVVLWGISSRERLGRQIASIESLSLVESTDELAGADQVLLLRADYLFEVRTLTALLERTGILTCEGTAAAAHVPHANLDEALSALLPDGTDTSSGALALTRFEVDELQTFEEELRRTNPPTLAPVREEDTTKLSNQLYGSAYKGVTDLVTKFWWPKPAKWVVAWCAERRITPNMVTGLGVLLMLFACWAFLEGYFIAGLVAGWIMTFLDTVDGKLARVTVKSSRVGHFLDHGMDIIHPPFWYWFWGLGLVVSPSLWGLEANTLYLWMLAGYVFGRIAEQAFHLLGRTAMFTWQPFDSYFRLVTGRRNPNLILMTFFTLIGMPDWAFYSVVIWTVLSTLILIVRLFMGLAVRQFTGEPLTSWMEDPEAAAAAHPAAFRTFSTTRSAYGNA
jgi:phosphatidylglycerophosphate synthase